MSSNPTFVLPCRRSARGVALGLVTLLIGAPLASCGSGEDHSQHAGHDGAASSAATSAPSSAPSSAPTGADASGAATSPVVVSQAWAKALPEPGTMMGMTAVFGDLVNRSESPVTITSATTSASEHTELHQTAGGKMSQVQSFTVPAGGTFALKPGGNHLMLMNVTKPIRPGDLVRVMLTTSDGRKIEFSAVAKTFTGAGEKYAQ